MLPVQCRASGEFRQDTQDASLKGLTPLGRWVRRQIAMLQNLAQSLAPPAYDIAFNKQPFAATVLSCHVGASLRNPCSCTPLHDEAEIS